MSFFSFSNFVEKIKLLRQLFVLKIISCNLFLSSLGLMAFLFFANSLRSRPLQLPGKLDTYLTFVVVLSGIFTSWFYHGDLQRIGGQKMTPKGRSGYALMLFLIFSIFFTIRVSFFNKPFGGVFNSGKYGAYLPYSISMYEEKNPFLNKNMGYTSIFEKETADYERRTFSHFPFYEWIFMLLMPLRSSFSLEVIVRGLMTILGLLLLFLIYLFFNEIFRREITLTCVLLLAVNSLFHIITYITSADIIALVSMFAALCSYLHGRKNLSYLFCGLSLLLKDTFLLITFPILALLIIFEEEDKFYHLFKLGILGILPLLLHFLLIKPIPSKEAGEAVVRLILMPLVIALVYFLIAKKGYLVQKLSGRIDNRIKYLLLPLLGSLVIFFLLKGKLTRFSTEFITDRFLIFNWRVYHGFLQKLKIQTPSLIFNLSPLGLVLALLDKNTRKVNLAILLTSLFYMVVAIKGIWFHIYYRHIFVIFLILCFGYVLNFVNRVSRSKLLKVAIILFLIIPLSNASIRQSTSWLKRELKGIKNTALYLNSRISEEEKILRTTADIKLLQLYGVKNPQVYVPFKGVVLQRLREEITSQNFGQYMKQHQAKYLISIGPADFSVFLNLFTSQIDDRGEVSIRRRLLLTQASEIETDYPEYREDLDIEELLEIYNPAQYFVLEEQIGEFYIYALK